MDLPVLASSAVSHTGPVREDNQDAVGLPDPQVGQARGYLYAVADGMGGYANGGMASRMALDALYSAVYAPGAAPGQASLRQGLERANLEIFKMAQKLEMGRMGTTLTAIFIYGNQLHLAHVGDSRAYLVRGQQATCLTRDHTQVADLVRAKVIPPDRLRGHPQRSILTHTIGLNPFVRPDFSRVSLQEQDRLILCSDGLWSVVEDEDFARLAGQARSAEALSQELINLGLERDTDDNLTALVVFVEHLARPQPGAGWLNAARSLVSRRLGGLNGKSRRSGRA